MNKRIVKKVISIVLIFIISFIGCKPQTVSTTETELIPVSSETVGVDEEEFPEVLLDADGNVLYSSMSDEALLDYIETDLYEKIVEELDSEDYLVETISAKYVSQEYIDELEYNSKPNVYFGYTLSELDEEYQGTRYVFTLGENGETIVEEFQEYDDTYEQVIRNVAIGTGVILVCVVVSIVTHGVADAAAVSVIFATAAKTGTIVALSDGVLSGVVFGAIEGIKTGNVEKAVKAGALEGSKSFKWGAICGTLIGGVSEAASLYNFTLNGLSMNEAAILQSKEKVPANVLQKLSSMDEYSEMVQNAKNGGPTIKEISKLLEDTDCPFDLAKKLKSVDEFYEIAKNADNGGISVKELNNIVKNTDCPLDLAKKLNSIDDYYEITKNAEKGGISVKDLAKLCSDTDCPMDLAKQLKNVDEYYEIVGNVKDGGMTVEEITQMCRETKYPVQVVKVIKSQAEKNIYYEQAKLYSEVVNGKPALVRDINLEFKLPGEELTNLDRMLLGDAPIDPVSGKAYQLHHVGQSVDSPLAILTITEHISGGNNAILHDPNIADGLGVHSLLKDSEWAAQKRAFWKAFAELVKP